MPSHTLSHTHIHIHSESCFWLDFLVLWFFIFKWHSSDGEWKIMTPARVRNRDFVYVEINSSLPRVFTSAFMRFNMRLYLNWNFHGWGVGKIVNRRPSNKCIEKYSKRYDAIL